MEQQPAKKRRGPASKLGKILINLIVTAVVGFLYFYVALPPINLQSSDFYTFIGILCVVYVVSALITSGMNVVSSGGGPKEYLRFIKTQCLPVGILFLALIAVAIVGSILSMPLFRAAAYRDLLTVEDGNFAEDIAEISFSEIPTLDKDSANFLGDRQMGTLSDMVSQFEYSNDSTQINYQGRPVRVAPIAYADLIKWFTNRSQGLPAYVIVDMVTQEATVVRLEDGMKYSFSEPLNRNIVRHLRFQYPTYMFGTPQFEIDEDGRPWWIAPRVVKTIGLFGGTDIKGAVLVDAITGESTYYEEVPTWVDNVYTPELIMEQYDYHGTLVNGFINSIFGQRDVTVTTQGSNYIALNDDVYMYTGVTSANADQSNLGFLLSNQRTKETKFYTAPGATEKAAQASAMGVVQDLGYIATFPLLLNIAGEPTYFIPLKDNTNLVKSYAMVNVAQYQIVATGSTVSECEQKYVQLLGSKGTTGTQASFLELFEGDHEKCRALERKIAAEMGFDAVVPVSGQTYSRKMDYAVLSTLSGIAQSASKFATDLRLLCHLKEVEEPFEKNQIGSSAMPYKRNPMRCERICALARYVMADAVNPAVTASAQWFERTLDDSANKRLSVPEAFLAVDAILSIYANVAGGLVVHEKVIERHVREELPFMASENILMDAVKRGGNRQELHERIRVLSQEAGANVKDCGLSNNLIELIAADPAFSMLSREELTAHLEPARYIGRCPQQVEDFLAHDVQPVLERYAAALQGKETELKV